MRHIKNIFTFPIAFVYVMVFLFYYFLKLFFEGNHIEYIIQILFVKIQDKLPKLVYRATWLAPIVYAIVALKILFVFCHIK